MHTTRAAVVTLLGVAIVCGITDTSALPRWAILMVNLLVIGGVGAVVRRSTRRPADHRQR